MMQQGFMQQSAHAETCTHT